MTSILLHVTLVATIVVAPGWGPVRVPVLIAELVEPEAPARLPSRPEPAPERRPLTPPRPISTPRPAPTAVSPPEPPPTPSIAPEPPPAPATAPEPHISEPRALSGAPPATDVSSQSITTAPTAVRATEGSPSPVSDPPAPPGPAPAPSSVSVTAVPGDTITQRATPRGGYQVLPSYPSTARRLGIQGTAMLQVLVSDDGRVTDVVVKNSAGHPDLDQAAVTAVRRWRFEPARRGTEPIAMWVQIPFEFKFR